MSATSYDWDSLGGEIMDSRSLIAVAEEIRDAVTEGGDLDDSLPVDSDEALEILEAIEELASTGLADWEYGETLIREDYFTEYAQQLAEDIGAIDSEASWPLYCIDWDRAASDLKQDYTKVSYLGTTYLARS